MATVAEAMAAAGQGSSSSCGSSCSCSCSSSSGGGGGGGLRGYLWLEVQRVVKPDTDMENPVRIYQWLTIPQLIEYVGNNYVVAATMLMGAPLQQLRYGTIVWLVQVAMY